MSAISGSPGGERPDPLDEAVIGLAREFHNHFLDELHGPGTPAGVSYQELTDTQRQAYPPYLFGQLAMYVAGVELPAQASPADRAKGVTEALRRIVTAPSLFEAVTRAPFSKDLAAAIGADLDKAGVRDKKEAAEAAALQEKIAQKGFLQQSMVPKGRTIQLEYQASAAHSRRRARQPQPRITLKLTPDSDRSWTVQQYGKYFSELNQFALPRGSREVVLAGLFKVLAVDYSNKKVKKLDGLLGNYVQIGQVSTGTLLKLSHNFMYHANELEGSPKAIQHATLSLPFQLRQAYFGTSRDFPLFPAPQHQH